MARVDELAVNTQRRIVWILLCLPFVVSLATVATRATCKDATVTHVDIARVYHQSIEQGCVRVKLSGVAREWSRGCTRPPPDPSTCTPLEGDPAQTARWVLGVIAAVCVVRGLWRRSLASITVDHGAGTIRIETDDEVSVVNIADGPELAKTKKGFVVQARSREPVVIGKGADPRDIALLRDLLASFEKPAPPTSRA